MVARALENAITLKEHLPVIAKAAVNIDSQNSGDAVFAQAPGFLLGKGDRPLPQKKEAASEKLPSRFIC